MLEAQAADQWCQDLVRQIDDGHKTTRPPGLFIDEAGTLCCSSPIHHELPPRWVVPASLRGRLCVLAHFSKAAGHPGTTKMTQTLSRLWYWPSMAKDCLATVRRCPNCAAKNLKRGPKKTTPLTIFPPNRPLEFIAMDVLGPLPTTSRGNRFVLCIGDRFSKMSVAVALPEQTASAVAQALMDRWIAVF
jgi:hypothetical protein